MIDFEAVFLRVANHVRESDSSLDLARRGATGVASAVPLVVTGSVAGAELTASSGSDVFQGGTAVGMSASWAAEEIRTSQAGVSMSSSSLVEGMVTYSVVDDDYYRATAIEVLSPSADGDWYVGESVESLWPDVPNVEFGVVYAMSLSAYVGIDKTGHVEGEPDVDDRRSYMLDGVYQGLRVGDRIVVEVIGVGHVPTTIEGAGLASLEIQDGVFVKVTRIWVGFGSLFSGVAEEKLKFWYDARKAGTIQRIPTETVTPEDILDTARPVTLAEDSTLPSVDSDIIIQDADGASLRARGSVDEDDPNSIIITDIDTDDFELELRKPITFLWGLSEVTRGKTVSLEVLGDGDASQPFQRFTLAESPLTYVADPDASGGRRAELTVYVDGVAWRQAQSFYGAEPDDRIFVVQHDEDHATHIVFGDGELGSRLPTGTGNVVATYRFGVGGNVDANTIDRLVRPIKGVTEVYNPLPATGGEDPPTEREARARAIESTRVLGKLVSLPDFEVEARRWGGVVNSRAEWAWNRRADEAMVRVWIVYPQLGDPSSKLRAYLQAMAEPSTRVEITKATPRAGTLAIELDIDPRHVTADVEAAVEAHLYDPHDGLLAPRNATIASATAGNFHRSTLHAAIHEVDGVLGVKTVTFAGAPLPRVLTLEEGEYFAPTAPGQG